MISRYVDQKKRGRHRGLKERQRLKKESRRKIEVPVGPMAGNPRNIKDGQKKVK